MASPGLISKELNTSALTDAGQSAACSQPDTEQVLCRESLASQTPVVRYNDLRTQKQIRNVSERYCARLVTRLITRTDCIAVVDTCILTSFMSQVIHWMRHGQTEMNVHLGRNFTPDADYQDPLL